MELGVDPGNSVLYWDPVASYPKGGGGVNPQIFGPCLLLPHIWMDEADIWHGGRP